MKKRACAGALILVLTAACLSLFSGRLFAQSQDDSSFITKETLKSKLGSTDVTIIDLRFGRDWTDATLKIKGAVREDPMKPGQWIDKYPKERLLVFY